MNRDVDERLEDVIRACRVIARYVSADTLPEDVVHDAVRMRLVEIGEAVRMLPVALTAGEPGIPWSRLSLLGERLTHRPADTTPALVLGTAQVDVPHLQQAAQRLRASQR
ncbi:MULTISPECIES: HepT-like ribonuclease domain-containing protein [unclassified Curtobacterium]|uniref:HepT-like ribonuclease domain-containing protein n=1 Tax=unclassified Curtobacterium TaxID=257496 RepID=UPI00226B59FE|nr:MULTISPECIES: HepT-like ribonuclease domain-containing protein [unclassified Curtobacterium]